MRTSRPAAATVMWGDVAMVATLLHRRRLPFPVVGARPAVTSAPMTGLRTEVVAVGTELLLGQIVDTNSSWIGEQLALAGIDSYAQTKVGDNWDRIADALRTALERSDAVIVCGGLGPTQDDITRDVIADVM